MHAYVQKVSLMKFNVSCELFDYYHSVTDMEQTLIKLSKQTCCSMNMFTIA